MHLLNLYCHLCALFVLELGLINHLVSWVHDLFYQLLKLRIFCLLERTEFYLALFEKRVHVCFTLGRFGGKRAVFVLAIWTLRH